MAQFAALVNLSNIYEIHNLTTPRTCTIVFPLACYATGAGNSKAMLNLPSMEARRYAGRQLVIDLIGAEKLDDLAYVATALEQCAFAAGAKILSRHLHAFPGGEGISVIFLLAESHISIHTWPEKKYAAVDIFMCGDADPNRALPKLQEAFSAKEIIVTEHLRGQW